MQKADVLVNIRPTGKGNPKRSYTVHTDLNCPRTSRFFDPESARWAWSTLDRVGSLSSEAIFGFCERCSKDKIDEGLGTKPPKNQKPPAEAKQLLTEDIERPAKVGEALKP